MNWILSAWLLTSSVVGIVLAQNITAEYVYIQHVDMYYKAYNSTPLKTWYEAKQTCANESGVLAMPRNVHEAEVLAGILKTFNTSISSIWLGFHDLFEETKFVGLNGIDLQYFYHVWNNGQPNSDSEDCVSMDRNALYSDFGCLTTAAFVCQMNGKTPKFFSDYGRCLTNDSAYVYYEDSAKFYKLHTSPRKWNEARVICDLECGHLAVIDNIHEEQFLAYMFNLPENQIQYISNRVSAYVGYHDFFKEGTFFTVTDKNLTSIGYQNWESGEPNNSGGNENCVTMTRLGLLNDVSCDSLYKFFCERSYNTYQYYSDVDLYYQFNVEPLTWYEARLKCAQDQASLALPQNQKEVDILTALFDKFKAPALNGLVQPDYTLLGFHDIFEESKFVSLSGKPLQYFYHKWEDNQPNNDKNEDCGSLHRSGKLNDISCNVSSTFICQKSGPNRKIPPVNYKCLSNDEAYTYADGINKCYKLHLNPKTWTAARDMCFSEGGHLAVVTSKAEEDFLVGLINNPDNRVLYTFSPNYILLGFHDLFREGRFTTVLGEHLQNLTYVNWGPGLPDNDVTENCGSMHLTGYINDFPCYVPSIFVCEQLSNPFYNKFLKNDFSSFLDYMKYIFRYQ